ncbi:hypothetical protein GCM10019016_031520 [Streptomyces prasinosporus]|uniref:Uncharacterized protein n=1 Tax=Streptomyces prasinosporus TaxID=68256 RepID=A0ABP6TNQ8_9ACTN
MADARPGARIVHIVRLALVRATRPFAPVFDRRVATDGTFKHSGEVILASIAFGPSRARLVASCSLVSLAVQSLRSM